MWWNFFNTKLIDIKKKNEFPHFRYLTTAGGKHPKELLVKLSDFFPNTEIIIDSSIGQLEMWYRNVKTVFLGKSYPPKGGQNPIEPARLGCKILHGPYVSNFAETYEYLRKLGITKKINNSNELSLSLVEEFKEDKAKNQEIAAKIENYGQNILNNVIMELKKYI